jgi:kynurenine formamidase
MVNNKFIDLTYTLHDSMPTWNNDPSFKQEIVMNYDEFSGKCKFYITKFDMMLALALILTHQDIVYRMHALWMKLS